MNKNTKILLGVGALAVIGYLIWKNNSPKANATGKGNILTQYTDVGAWQNKCTNCYKDVQELGNGDKVYTCKNGNHAPAIADGVKPCK